MTKREKIAEIYNVPLKMICCKYCDRKEQYSTGCPYCTWHRMVCKDENEDYCKYWINTQFHK